MSSKLMPNILSNEKAQLRVYNSLTRRKEVFVSRIPHQITWYCCGPTVYDSAHMGHARAYISFDIIRRILQNYFSFNVNYVMNITDIDDKIIKRARRSFLWKSFIDDQKFKDFENLMSLLHEAVKNYEEQIEQTADQDLKDYRKKFIMEIKLKIKNLSESTLDVNAFQDLISDYLDKREGVNVTDHSIFFKLTRFYENEFLEDMCKLNVLLPTMMPRISQFVPEVVSFIEEIIKNGFAYSSNGSVYFDTMKFSETHKYAKLVPEAVGDALALKTGELTVGTSEKKSSRDFVLWKSSKPGEPSWPSPWGPGRPGWHIECSTMGGYILGDNMDIHSGGFDLKFPHHDNEMAQSEAFYTNHQWVNYFLHAGHLTIEGQKMSKSLKNFITIREALERYTSSQIRFAFLMHQWDGPLDFSENVMNHAIQTEKHFINYFSTIKSLINSNKMIDGNAFDDGKEVCISSSCHNFSNETLELNKMLITSQGMIHEAICGMFVEVNNIFKDNFDTSKALSELKNLTSNVYIYVKTVNKTKINLDVIKHVSSFVNRILEIFGITGINWSLSSYENNNETKEKFENFAWPYLQVLANFRESVRTLARNEKSIYTVIFFIEIDADLLKLCDELRDTHLVNLGVKLEDAEGDSQPVIKFMDRDQILLELEQKKLAKVQLLEAKEEKKRVQQQNEIMRKQKSSIPPEKLFLEQNDKYSSFDENGLPTHDINGDALTKSALKKLQKQYMIQKKLHENFLNENK